MADMGSFPRAYGLHRLDHGGVCGRIHNDTGPFTPHQHTQTIRIREVAVSPRHHDNLISEWCAGLQRVTHLPAATKEKYAHIVTDFDQWRIVRRGGGFR